MQAPLTSPSPQRPFFKPPAPGSLPKGGLGKWYLPTMAAIALGFGITNYLTTPKPTYAFDAAEEERISKNEQLMDAYGDKDNLQDIERALALYEMQ